MDSSIYNMLLDLRHYSKVNRRKIIIKSLSDVYRGRELRDQVRKYEYFIRHGFPAVTELVWQ